MLRLDVKILGLGLHVPISRRRPQTNGIAERMVRTLKEWLRGETWKTAGELDDLLGMFVADYNDRPHQGQGLDASHQPSTRSGCSAPWAVQRVFDHYIKRTNRCPNPIPPFGLFSSFCS
ncbi:integrase core domain-containing protein [Herpetosiphon giganteus]|uniref:integrase core domain-containing protein n=1 Tax=Herpetosiphon giganteus TaxID=2029754 RepID=UPI003B835F93